MWKIALKIFERIWSALDPFNFFEGCLPQVLIGPFWNTLSQVKYLHVARKISVMTSLLATRKSLCGPRSNWFCITIEELLFIN